MAKDYIPEEITDPPLRDIWNDAVGKLKPKQYDAISKGYKADALPKALNEWPQEFPDLGKMKAVRGRIDKMIKDLEKLIKSADGLGDDGKKLLNNALKDLDKEIDERETLAKKLINSPKYEQMKFVIDNVLKSGSSPSSQQYDVLRKEGLIAGGEFSLRTDLKLPQVPGKPPLDVKSMQKAGDKRYEEIAKQLCTAIDDGLATLVKLKEENDFKKARDCVEKINKFAEELLEDAPAELREAVSKAAKVSAADFESINDLTTKKMSIPRGSFASDNASVLDDAPDYASLLDGLWPKREAMKSGNADKRANPEKEIFFQLLIADGDSMVLLDEGKKIKPSEWEKYYGEKPDIVEGSFLTIPSADRTLKYKSSIGNKSKEMEKAFKAQGGKDIKFD